MLRGTNGKYFISFFCIYADTEKKPEEFTNINILPTLVHEYIHFLQDVSTIYGMNCIAQKFDSVSILYNTNEAELKLPYKISNLEKEYQNNKDIFDFSFFVSQYMTLPKYDWDVELIIKKTSEYLTSEYDFDYYNVKLISENGTVNFDFGAHAIMEGMAHMIEDHLFQNDRNFYSMPYDLPYILTKYLYEEISFIPGFIVALCDASLMFYQPANAFIIGLKLMKLKSFLPSHINEIYGFMFTNIVIVGHKYIDIWKEVKERTKERIETIVNFNEYDFAKNWATNFIEDTYRYRMDNPSFLSGLMMEKPQDAQQKLFNFLKNRISPIIFTKKLDFGIITSKKIEHADKKRLFYWYYLYCFYNFIFFYQKNNNCPFGKLCKIKDKSCEINPLSKIWKNEICKFQEFIRMFGLKGKSITKNEK